MLLDVGFLRAPLLRLADKEDLPPPCFPSSGGDARLKERSLPSVRDGLPTMLMLGLGLAPLHASLRRRETLPGLCSAPLGPNTDTFQSVYLPTTPLFCRDLFPDVLRQLFFLCEHVYCFILVTLRKSPLVGDFILVIIGCLIVNAELTIFNVGGRRYCRV